LLTQSLHPSHTPPTHGQCSDSAATQASAEYGSDHAFCAGLATPVSWWKSAEW